MKKFLLIFTLMFGATWLNVMAQNLTITGKLTDAETGAPVEFALVTVKGTTVGATTNLDGEYAITLPSAGSHVLVFSCLGYDNREVNVDAKTTVLDVKLRNSTVAIDDVVVTGFQNVKKQTFAGSSVKVAMDDISVGGGVDVSRMLEGKVAGVSIQNVSSTFGAAPKVRVRGVTSINGENKPLWVVDGVVLEDMVNVSNDQLSSGDPTTLLGSSVAGLNNSDIESMDILKDAAATAMYGARAMNGVIVITTKRGKEGAPRINYNANFTIRQKPRYENFDIMNSADQMAVNAELYRKGLLNVNMVNWSNYGPYGLMYNKINVFDPEKGFELINTPAERANFLQKYVLANTDWFDLLFTNKIMQEHSISMSSGTERSKTYSSLSYLNDAGSTIADKVNRYTFNVRNDFKLSEKISTVLQVVGSFREQYVPGSFSRGSDPVHGTWSRDFDINPFSYAYNTSRAVRPYDDNGDYEFVQMNFAPFNILHELKENWMEFNVVDVRAQGELHYQILPNLRLSTMGSLRFVNSDQDHIITENSNVAKAYRAADNSLMRDSNPFLWKDIDDPANEKITVLPKGGFYNTRKDVLKHYNARATLTYNKLWNEGTYMHEMSAFGGSEVKYSDRYRNTNTGVGYLHYDGGRFVESSDYARMLKERNAERTTSNFYYERFAAFFVNADYTFDRRYTASFSGRYDGSNQLGKGSNSRWLPTWTVAAKWNISNEKFMENTQDYIDALGFRASYGLTATMPPTANSTAIFYSDPTFAPGGYQQDAIVIQDLANKDLTWEKSYMLNLGVDLQMFQDRFNVSLEYWNRQSFDLIADIKTGGVGGYLYRKANYADLYSWGYDITIGGTPIKTRDWRWTVNFTLGYSFDEIRNMKSLPQIFQLVGQTGGNKNGYPVNSIFSVPFAGLDEERGTPQFLGPDGSIVEDAYLQSVNTDYLTYHGPVDPRYTGGLNNTVTYKSFSFSVFLSYQLGNYVRLNPSFAQSYSDLSGLSKDFKDRWMASDGWFETQTPAILGRLEAAESTGTYSYNIYNYSDARIAKGDFLRLKSLTFGYDLPSDWVQKSKVFRTANVRITAKDLWLIWSDKKLNGQDPEFLNTGGVALPALPSFILSISIGF